MPTLCAGCGRPPASKTAQRCTYCGSSFVNAPAVLPATALKPSRTGVTETDVPFPDDVTEIDVSRVAAVDPWAAPRRPGAMPTEVAAPSPTAVAAHPRSPTVVPDAPPQPLPAAAPSTTRPSAKLSAEARAILEAAEPPVWQQILMFPFATRARTIGVSLVAFIALAIFSINALIESSKAPETARGPAFDTRPGGGLQPVFPDGMAPGQAEPRAQPAPAGQRSAEIALQKIADALLAYGHLHSGLPERLSEDLHELYEVGDLKGELVHFQAGSFSYRHFTRVNLDSDSGEVTATPRRGGDALKLKVEWTKKPKYYSGTRSNTR